jgi:hypothetical protein
MKKLGLGLICFAAVQVAFAQPQPGTVLWTYDAGVTIGTSPAVAPDGTVHITAAGLLAITNNGSLASNKWTFLLNREPVVGTDGTIYVVDGDGAHSSSALLAISQNGTQKWTVPAGGGPGTAAVGFDNTVYFLGGGELYAVSPSGIIRWHQFATFDTVPYSPVIGRDGSIYFGLMRTFYCFTSAGTKRWSASVQGGGWLSPAIDAQGDVYVSANAFYAFSPAGSNLWSIGGGFFGSPVIGPAGNVYVADGSRNLHAITPAGELDWQTTLQGLSFGALTSPAIDAAGTIYYCISNSVWALNSQGQPQWKVTTSETTPSNSELANTSPTIGPDGTLYVAVGRTLYAIATGTNGPANSAWPMYRQNARHTGKIEKPALRQPQKRSDANFQFQLYGQLGQTFTVEATTNFNTWTSVTSFVANTLPMDVVDLSASNHPSRFYRASSPP